MPYLDHNGTTPVRAEVAAAMAEGLGECFGNPSSGHAYGVRAKKRVDEARRNVAALVNCEPADVVFESCGTEADTHAIWGAAMRARVAFHVDKPHVVASAAEHPAVVETLRLYAELGVCTHTLAPVGADGRPDPQAVADAVGCDTCLVTCMHANNEVGALTDVAAVADACRARAAELGQPDRLLLVHTDAAQSVGKVPVDVVSMKADLLTLVGHKFGAPKGCAALVVASADLREGPTRLVPLLSGGSQEAGMRAGTENVPYMVGLGEACRLARAELPDYQSHTEALRERLRVELTELATAHGVDVRVHGPAAPGARLPNTLSIALLGVDAKALLGAVGADGVAASGGAACHSTGAVAGSHVLVAMGHGGNADVLRGTMRLSVGASTTADDVTRALDAINGAVEDAKVTKH